jgi:glycine/D-amino acid oxidase-like deaminating enzyme
MRPDFQYAIVGRGLMGSAAARHLAGQVEGVVLIGPDEPQDKATHDGVFASHYDEGRITRTIDPDEIWARFANRSIARYREIEAQSGITFFSETGCLISGATTGHAQDYVSDIRKASALLGAVTEDLDDAGLAGKFPYFSFPAGSDAVFEPKGAGYISPRRLVEAQTKCVEVRGGSVIRKRAVGVRPKGAYAEVTLADGEVITAAKVLVAAGGFTNGQDLLPEPLDLKVYARTVAFFELGEAERTRLADMPSLIWEAEDPALGIYLLPPIRYPDGRTYMKIGGDPVDIPLASLSDIIAWFRTDGDVATRDHLVETMHRLVPDLRVLNITSTSCVTSFTPTGYPAVGWTSEPTIAVLAGGCGAAAKSSDEIGRLGAELLLHGSIVDTAYTADFKPRFL